MEKSLNEGELESNESDTYEFIDEKEEETRCSSESKISEEATLEEPSVSDDVRLLNSKETFLANRVRTLQHENEELKRAVQINGDALKLCSTEISSWNERQREIHSSWCEKYEQARRIVINLRNDNSHLKSQLEKINAEHVKPTAIPQEENVSNEKDISSLKEHVKQFFDLSDNDRQIQESSFYQDLVKICNSLEKSKSFDNEEAIIISLKDELARLNITCNEKNVSLVQEKAKRLETERQNKELEKQLSAKAIPGNEPHQSSLKDQSTDTTGRQNYDEENRSLKEKMEREKDLCEKREIKYLNQCEEALKKTVELKEQLKEAEEKNAMLEREITTKKDAIEQLMEEQNNQEMTNDIKEEMNQQIEMLKSQNNQEMTNNIKEKMNQQIETLKSQVCSFYQELQEKETESDTWREQEQQYQQNINDLKITISKLKDDLNLTQNTLIQTRNEFSMMCARHEKLVGENQSLRGTRGDEIADLQSKVDNLTAQVISAEEIVENKEQDYQKLEHDYDNLRKEHETFAILKQQLDLYQTDFNAERQVRLEREEQCRRLTEDLMRIQAENEKLIEDLNDSSGSRMAELQRRHGNPGSNPWNASFDQYLAPRGQPSINYPLPQEREADMNRQVSGGSCPKCERVFNDLDALQTHVVRCIESECNSTVGERMCPKCQEPFPDLDTLQIHVMECLDN